MGTHDDIRDFLMSRRAKISPDKAGLPAYGGNRRVKGLRREEVAMLAGVSVDYYTKLERGNFGTVSESVLDAIARALQLDDAEREHLFHLTNASATIRPSRGRRLPRVVRPSVQRILDGITDAPAFASNYRADVLGMNTLGAALYSELLADATDAQPVNTARFLFLSARARDFYPDWNKVAADSVAALRTEVGRNPYDRPLQELVGELTARSDEFSTAWAKYDVRYHQSGVKHIHHPVVGDLHLTYEAMQLPADPGQHLVVYGAEPGSPTESGLRLLANWATTDAESAPAAAGSSAPAKAAGSAAPTAS